MEQPRTPLGLPPTNPNSPPPNCAICLGSCRKRCFSDSCMHQFCFRCLLKWSRVKAECPLCKQPFTSIIHNIKSSCKYDKHTIPQDRYEQIPVFDSESFMYIPAPYHINTPENDLEYGSFFQPRGVYAGNFIAQRTDTSSTNFRRSVYALNLWVTPPYTNRIVFLSPRYFRDNPGARQRLVPWLNRELNVLLYENTQHVMYVVDIILEQLLTHHILSSAFRVMLSEYLGPNTDHFIHEFYNFMRSPYDMIEYDRHIVCLNRDQPTNIFSDYSDDSSDVVVVTPPQVDVIEINSDTDNSDVIIQEPPPPEVVDLLEESENDNNNEVEEEVQPEADRKPILPLKIRLKHKRRWREKTRCQQRNHSSSSSSSEEGSERKHKKRSRRKRRICSSDSSSESSWQVVKDEDESTTDTEDDLPLAKLLKREESKSDVSSGGSPSRTDCMYIRSYTPPVVRMPEIGEPGPQSQCRFQEEEETPRENLNGASSLFEGIGTEGERTVWYEQLMSLCGAVNDLD